MPGGLLNLIAYGNQNIILNGNPSKTFFKSSYAKYTNFGMQKFRIDFNGQKTLRLNQPSKFNFKIPRHADLLMDTYLIINLPTIWSPIFKTNDDDPTFIPYEFKWIKNLGCNIISEITFTIGGHIIQKYSGAYLQNMIERDFNNNKKELFNDMTGNIAELNDPASVFSKYPSAIYDSSYSSGPEPSIRAKTLYIPINSWFSLSSKMAFPLISLHYNELQIEFTLRPIKELFVIKDVLNSNNTGHIQANQHIGAYGFYRFIQPPPGPTAYVTDISNEYTDHRTNWHTDLHLLSTYCFLSKDEASVFSTNQQNYLIKEIKEYKYTNLIGSDKVLLPSSGMVSNWMWFFQRSDINLRNEWGNYTNWEYDRRPTSIIQSPDVSDNYISGEYNPENYKNIMLQMGILCDGKYRENMQSAGIYDKVEKYFRTNGGSLNVNADGLYCYNFCMNTDPFNLQPNGAFNTSKFNNIEFEFVLNEPTRDISAQVIHICDEDGDIIGIEKNPWSLYKYHYDLTIQEERYNILKFIGGNASLMYAI